MSAAFVESCICFFGRIMSGRLTADSRPPDSGFDFDLQPDEEYLQCIDDSGDALSFDIIIRTNSPQVQTLTLMVKFYEHSNTSQWKNYSESWHKSQWILKDN